MGRTGWHLALDKVYLYVLHKIWELAEEKLKREEIKNILLLFTERNGRFPCHLRSQVGNLGFLYKIWYWSNKKLTTEEIKNELLLGKD